MSSEQNIDDLKKIMEGAMVKILQLANHPVAEAGQKSPSSILMSDSTPTINKSSEDIKADLFRTSFEVMASCLQRENRLCVTFFTLPGFSSFVVDVVIRCPVEQVSKDAARFLFMWSNPSSQGTSRFRQLILCVLLRNKPIANKYPQCSTYWDLLVGLIPTSDEPRESILRTRLLRTMLSWLMLAPAATEASDTRLEGCLRMLNSLICVQKGEKANFSERLDGSSLIQLLFKEFLFPEAFWLFEEAKGLSPAPRPQFGYLKSSPEAPALTPKCGTARSRKAAFRLLETLSGASFENLVEIADTIRKLHLTEDIGKELECSPTYQDRVEGDYAGLANASATCYMNSIIQQLYMQPRIRKSILLQAECDAEMQKDSLAFQLQEVFASLTGTNRHFVIPEGFWQASKDYDGDPIDLASHEDAFEFFTRLYDAVDGTMKAANHELPLSSIIGGKTSQTVECRTCGHVSERVEPFCALTLDVVGKKDLQESLDAFVATEVMEGENAYLCAKCDKKVSAEKRVLVKELPEMLLVQLKRFAYNYATEEGEKINDRLEFPTEIDMARYTTEGGRATRSPPPPPPQPLDDQDVMAVNEEEDCGQESPPKRQLLDLSGDELQWKARGNRSSSPAGEEGGEQSDSLYELCGVVVHSGAADFGHYYSYIKERGGGRAEKDSSRWFNFNDKSVEPYNLEDLDEDTFGGDRIVDYEETAPGKKEPVIGPADASAYMLVYERKKTTSEEPTLSPSKGARKRCSAEASPPSSLEIHGSARDDTLPIPPCIHKGIWTGNLRHIHETRTMDEAYFGFILSMVRQSVASAAAVKKQYSDSDSEELEHLSRAKQLLKFCMEFSEDFLFRVFCRVSVEYRENVHIWKDILETLLEDPDLAKRFLQGIHGKSHYVLSYLLLSPSEDVRKLMAAAIGKAMTTALKVLESRGEALGSGRGGDSMGLDQAIDGLLGYLPKCSAYPGLDVFPQQYSELLLCYAKQGILHFENLLQKGFIPLVVNFSGNFTPQSNNSDLTSLHVLVASLVTNCDISKYSEPPVIKGKTAACGRNPYQKGVVSRTPLSRESYEALCSPEYLGTLVSHNTSQEVIALLEYLTWNNAANTTVVLSEAMKSVEKSTFPLRSTLALSLLFRLVQVQDHMYRDRHALILFGGSNVNHSHGGVVDFILGKNGQHLKKVELTKFLLQAIRRTQVIREILKYRLNKWRRIVDWLEKEAAMWPFLQSLYLEAKDVLLSLQQ